MEDIRNYSPTVMFRGTPCILPFLMFTINIINIYKFSQWFKKSKPLGNLDLVQLLDVGVSVNDQPILGVAISAGVRNRAQLRPMVNMQFQAISFVYFLNQW